MKSVVQNCPEAVEIRPGTETSRRMQMLRCKIVGRVFFSEIGALEFRNVESAYDEFFFCRQNQLPRSEFEMKDSILVGCIKID